jgi:DNA-directed RNA polymerase subunit RPC12/RpoP
VPDPSPAPLVGHSDSGYNTRGKRVECPCCGHRVTVRGNQTWKQRTGPERIRIVSAERDGAIVEQIGREDVEPRWGLSYVALPGGSGLLTDFVKES